MRWKSRPAYACRFSGVEEAQLTFLSARRWYGWSAGRITNLDIGGGSLELSTGTDEHPDSRLPRLGRWPLDP